MKMLDKEFFLVKYSGRKDGNKEIPHFAGFFYLSPLARQHADAADFQSEYCFDGVRKSRHGCQPLQRFLAPLPVHLAYLRKVHVWFDVLPVSVVHFTTTF